MRNIYLPVLGLWLLASCGQSSTNPSGSSAPAASTQDTVAVFLLHADTLKKSVDLPGELQPYLQTDLFAKVQGYVRQIKVDIGDRIRKGQTLAILEAPEVNTQVSQSEAALASLVSKYTASKDKYQRLYQASQSESPGIVAPVDLVSSHDQMAADSAAYEAMRQQSKAYKEVSGYLYITAPFDGVVIARKADPGALVSASNMLLTVQDNDILRLRISIPESYVAASTGKRDLSFAVDAYPQQRFTGTLTRKTGAIDPITRTELWEYEVDNKQHLLKAGAFVYARLNLERNTPSLVLPPTAIATTLERKFVIRVHNGVTQWVDVRQGMTTDAGIEVFGELHPGDTLLTKASDEHKPGTSAYWKFTRF
ncbi:MAG: efflux RND transporter periplasmic adaptor subunit [Bacteroidetes bacterium]|nr:efflux RND transporter periplasmic adaptor subunit [Bacteroidota bacterium]